MEEIQHHKASVSSCAACGTAPVNHRSAYIESIVENAMEKMSDFLFGWISIPPESRIVHIFLRGFVGGFKLIGCAQYSDDISKAVSGRSELIWKEAQRRGIKMQQIIMFKKPLEQYRAKITGQWKYFQSIPVPDWLAQGGYDWMDDKLLLSEKLNEAGVRAPKAKKVSSLKNAFKQFEKLQKPVIVKPRTGSRARHTTTYIMTTDQLAAAYKLGKMISSSLIIEEHLFGSVYRATVIGNKLVGFFRGSPPQVIADGTHTIRELIELKNKNKPEKISDIVVNDDVLAFLARKNFTLDSIPEKDLVVDLSAKTGRFYGGYTKEMFPEIHPKWHDIFKKAAEAVKAPIVGFDVIMEDPTKDPDSQTWGIIESNSMPFIDLHYFAYEGTPIDLSKNVWDLWNK